MTIKYTPPPANQRFSHHDEPEVQWAKLNARVKDHRAAVLADTNSEKAADEAALALKMQLYNEIVIAQICGLFVRPPAL